MNCNLIRPRWKKRNIKPSDLSLKHIVGIGSFATVYCGYWIKTKVAVKVIRSRPNKTSGYLRDSLMDEAYLWVKLIHPHVVTFLGAHISDGPNMYIVTEFMERGSVSDLLHNKNLVVEYEHVRSIAKDCCKGMAYLHHNNVIHRDLKTPNLLVDNQWKIKVSDFGLSRFVKDSDTAQRLTACGTPSWAAPEVLNDLKYSQKADVYSFAICLWELCTRKDPYTNMSAPQVVLFVAVKNKRLKIPKSVPQAFVDLINDTWKTDPNDRPEFITLADRFEALSNIPVPLQPYPYELSALAHLSQNLRPDSLSINDEVIADKFKPAPPVTLLDTARVVGINADDSSSSSENTEYTIV